MQQEDGCMRMPQAVTGDGRDAGSDACMSQALIHCINRDRIPIDAVALLVSAWIEMTSS